MEIQALQPALEKARQQLLSGDVLLTKAGLLAEAAAKLRAPVKTGTLRRDISSRVDGNVAYIGNSVEYAPFVHEGTSHMAGRPYLQWGIEDAVGDIEKMMRAVADEILSKVGNH